MIETGIIKQKEKNTRVTQTLDLNIERLDCVCIHIRKIFQNEFTSIYEIINQIIVFKNKMQMANEVIFSEKKRITKSNRNGVQRNRINIKKTHNESNTSNSISNGVEDINHAGQNNYQNSQSLMLNFKVEQLQKMCKQLSHSNNKLMKRIQDLENENESKYNFVDEFSQMQTQFSEVEELIHQYRAQLQIYQQKQTEEIKYKNQTIHQLKIQMMNVIESNATLTQQNIEMEESNRMLEFRNQQLRLDIAKLKEGFQRTPRKSTRIGTQIHSNTHSKTPSSYYPTYSRQPKITIENFYQKIANEEVEILVQRLIDELEQQRHLKHKMAQQIKRITKELNNTEKQIMEKNNKIYILQLNAIKNAKTLRISKSTDNLNENFHSPVQRNTTQTPQTFTLIDLLNGDVTISEIGKLQIAKKIIKLFDRKLHIKDFTQIMIQDLEIVNFSENHVTIFGVRKLSKRKSFVNLERQDYKNTDVIWNLAFILDNLLTQVEETQQRITQDIRNCKEKAVFWIQKTLQNDIKDHSLDEIMNILERVVGK